MLVFHFYVTLCLGSAQRTWKADSDTFVTLCVWSGHQITVPLSQKLVNTIMDAVDTVSSKQNSSFSTILNDTGDDFDIEVASVASSDDGHDDGETTNDPAGGAAGGISVDRADFMIEKLSQLEAELDRLKMENERLAEGGARRAPSPAARAAAAHPTTPTQASAAPTHTSPGTQVAVQQHRSALSAVLSGLGGAKATLRPAGDASNEATPRAAAPAMGMEGMLKASMAQRRMRLQEGEDDISIASDSSFESPGSAAAPPTAVAAAAARRHRRTSTAPNLSSPLVAGLSPIGPPSAGSATSDGSGTSAARRRSSVSGRAKRRLATGAAGADAHPTSPLSQGRHSMGGNGAVPLPRAMAMPSASAAPRLPAPPAAAAVAATPSSVPARPAGMGALLGAIKSKGGVKGLKKAPKPAAAAPKPPAAGGLLGAIASFDKKKGLRKAKKTGSAPAPAAAAASSSGGLNPAALMSAAARLNKTPRAGKGAPRAAAAAAAAPSMCSPFGDMGAIKLRSTGRRAALK